MAEYKAGLHKGITAIFDGVPIPKNNLVAGQTTVAAPARTGLTSPEMPSPVPPPQPLPKEHLPAMPMPQPAASKRYKAETVMKIPSYKLLKPTLEKIKNKLFAPKPGVNSSRQMAMVILVPVLFIVLIFVLFSVFRTPPIKMAEPANVEQPTVAVNSSDKVDWQIPDPYPTTLRDPMRPGSATIPGSGEIIVKGILYSDDKSSAVIGSQIMREGEKISDVTITKINKDCVEFESNGKKWTQKVQP